MSQTKQPRPDVRDRDGRPSNRTDNPHIRELMAERITRRGLLQGLTATVGGAALSSMGMPQSAEAAGSSLGFREIAHGLDHTHHVPRGYRTDIVVRWGDPIFAGAPAFDAKKQSPAAQARQFGYNNDFLAFMPLPRGSNASDRGLLFANHEYTNGEMMWPGIADNNAKRDKLTAEQVAVEMNAHGLSVVEIKRTDGRWHTVVNSRFNRRFVTSTPFRVSGPAASHPRMRTKADPTGTVALGTLNNCAGGTTPWHTCLSGEENINNFFTGDSSKSPEANNHKRFGLSTRPRNPWFKFDERFDVEKEPNEPNRFGWIVEVDPFDPKSTPVKRTALGRMKHEGATTFVGKDNRLALYTGDDQVFEYVYKFVASKSFTPGNRAANRDLLDDGILYVARFDAGGTMQWLPLVHGQSPLTAANGFNSQADVMIETRRAADLVGATKMDRPEDIEVNPKSGRVYIVLTKNAGRKPEQIDPANPRADNAFGHIIEIVPPGGTGAKSDHAATTCAWEFFIKCGDPKNPKHGAQYGGPVSSEGWLATPDNVAFDNRGRIWIVTDGQDDAANFADSVYAADTAGPGRGITKLFFNGPRGSEVCGPCFTPDCTTLFVAIQHPGEEKGSTLDNPSTRWPDFKPDRPPRPAVVAITKRNGGIIGS